MDHAGQTVAVVHPQTGEIRQAHIFVPTLGASSYTFAEAHVSEDLPSWISGHVAPWPFSAA